MTALNQKKYDASLALFDVVTETLEESIIAHTNFDRSHSSMDTIWGTLITNNTHASSVF
jgi:hypothetical protein